MSAIALEYDAEGWEQKPQVPLQEPPEAPRVGLARRLTTCVAQRIPRSPQPLSTTSLGL